MIHSINSTQLSPSLCLTSLRLQIGSDCAFATGTFLDLSWNLGECLGVGGSIWQQLENYPLPENRRNGVA